MKLFMKELQEDNMSIFIDKNNNISYFYQPSTIIFNNEINENYYCMISESFFNNKTIIKCIFQYQESYTYKEKK